MINNIFTCVLMLGFIALCATSTVSMCFTISEQRKQAKRNELRELRDIEYHEKRMRDFK